LHSGAIIDALRNRNRVRICVRVVTGQLSVAWGGGDVVVGVLRGHGMYGTGLSLSIERQCYRADLDAEKTGEEEG